MFFFIDFSDMSLSFIEKLIINMTQNPFNWAAEANISMTYIPLTNIPTGTRVPVEPQ